MKTSLRILGVAGLVTGVVVAANALQAYNLLRVAKVGDVIKYKYSADVDFAGQSATITFTTVDKVTNVAQNGDISTESKQENMKINFGGQEMAPEDQPARVTVTKPSGEIVTISGDGIDGTAYRFSNMSGIRAPQAAVKIGEKWSYEVKADGKTGSVAAKCDCEALAIEKVGDLESVKVKWSYKETEGAEPAGSEGTAWISTKDGSVVKAFGKFTKAPIPGAPGPVDMSFTMDRI